MPSQLGYWKIRGLAQPIRLLLNYAGEEFEDVQYECGDAPEYNRDGWFKVKFTLGLDFPNLPYYISDEVKLTQTNTIIRHLARKHNLYGSNDTERAHVDLMLDVIMDLRNSFVQLCYGSEYNDKIREAYIEKTKPVLETLEKYLGDKSFFAGDKVTACDFHIYEMLEEHRLFEESLLSERPKLSQYLKRFEELPAIKKYMSSDKFLKRPINNKMANFK